MGRIKILFVMPSLNTGGAERVTLNLINELDTKSFNPSIYLFRKEGALLKEVPEGVKVYGTKNIKTKFAFLSLGKFLQKEPFDLVYSVTDGANIAVIIAKLFFQLKLKIVTSSHSTFEKMEFTNLLTKSLAYHLIHNLYPFADKSVVISKDALTSYKKTFPKSSNNFECIYNAAFDNTIFEKAKAEVTAFPKNTIRLFSCGRLVKPKGYPYLIEAVNQLKTKYPDVYLVIGGDGPDRTKLEKQIEKSGLSDHVKLLGNLKNPFKFMNACDIYVHSSLWDGLPTTLIEAMACGAPVVSTDCDSGPREIIKNEEDGLLISPPGNAKALADGIERLILDEKLRNKIKSNAPKRADYFSSKNIVKHYENLFKTLLK